MKKILPVLLFCLVMKNAIAQTETFDIINYKAPLNFTKSDKPGVVIYTNINTGTGSFCMIAIYASTTSAGNEKKDFANEWKDLVITPYKAAPNPRTETQTSPEGWKVIAGAAPIKLESADAYSLLTVFSGFNKKVSVLATFNNQSYIGTIDSLLQNIKLDKIAKAAVTIPADLPVTTINGTNGKFGTMNYTVPKGWNLTKYPDGDIIMPADIPKGEFLEMWLQPAMNFSGTMEQALQKSYDETVAILKGTKMNEVNGGNYTAMAAKKSFRGWEYIRCSGGIHMGGGEYPREYGLDLFLIKINGRFEQIAIIKSRNNCGVSTYYATDRLKYYNEIENFLFSVQFSDWKDPLIKTGTAKGNGIIGVWRGISMGVGIVKPGASSGAEYKVKSLILFSNGQAYFGTNFPTEGLDEINTLVKAESNRRDWGTFSFSNGKGLLKLPYADIPLRTETNKLVVTTNKANHSFIKINAADAASFKGTYALAEYNGKIPSIIFTEDGKFIDNGAVSILYHDYVDCINPAKEPGSGNYEVKNYSLIFNYTDGRKIKIAFIQMDYDKNNRSPASLALSYNEDMLKKKQ
ncbi:MAG: hypothetical protein ABI480_08265 [Chitinophagaceae bacterium]